MQACGVALSKMTYGNIYKKNILFGLRLSGKPSFCFIRRRLLYTETESSPSHSSRQLPKLSSILSLLSRVY
jgi:hypothetical protein